MSVYREPKSIGIHNLPTETITHIFRLACIDFPPPHFLNEDIEDSDLCPLPWLNECKRPIIKKPARIASYVCKSWRTLILADPQLKMVWLGYSDDERTMWDSESEDSEAMEEDPDENYYNGWDEDEGSDEDGDEDENEEEKPTEPEDPPYDIKEEEYGSRAAGWREILAKSGDCDVYIQHHKKIRFRQLRALINDYGHRVIGLHLLHWSAKELEQILHPVNEASRLSRLRTLQIDWQLSDGRFPFSQLELDLRQSLAEEVKLTIDTISPLEYLSVSGFKCDYRYLLSQKEWPTVKILEVYAPDKVDLESIISHTPSLRQLIVDRLESGAGYVESGMEAVDLPRLSEVSIPNLYLPSLQHLLVTLPIENIRRMSIFLPGETPEGIVAPDSSPSLNFFNLERLSIAVRENSLTSYLTFFRVPKLECLRIQFEDRLAIERFSLIEATSLTRLEIGGSIHNAHTCIHSLPDSIALSELVFDITSNTSVPLLDIRDVNSSITSLSLFTKPDYSPPATQKVAFSLFLKSMPNIEHLILPLHDEWGSKRFRLDPIFGSLDVISNLKLITVEGDDWNLAATYSKKFLQYLELRHKNGRPLKSLRLEGSGSITNGMWVNFKEYVENAELGERVEIRLDKGSMGRA